MTPRIRNLVAVAGFMGAASCAHVDGGLGDVSIAAPSALSLPAPITNNAVTLVEAEKRATAYSFNGLHAGKTWEDVTSDAYACDLVTKACRAIAGLPDGVGRLASVAVTVDRAILIFGGYTVAQDGAERSTPQTWIFDPDEERYEPRAPMPTPTDDAVALVYGNRWVYVVSGWHGDGETPGDNVALVQVYDVAEDRWFAATDWPGTPVFGHAGGMVDGVMVVCDGVKAVPASEPGGRRSFVGSAECWRGDVDPADPAVISWRFLASLAPANYRMAAAGDPATNRILFVGGSDNPYNYDGVGYDGVPSAPSIHVWAYDIEADTFVVLDDRPIATMDHRGLLIWNDQLITLGGMGAGQAVLDDVVMSDRP